MKNCDKPTASPLLHEQFKEPAELVCYCSQYCNNAKQPYDKTHKEHFAVMRNELLSRLFLKGSQFTVLKDHNVGQWIVSRIDKTRIESDGSQVHLSTVLKSSIRWGLTWGIGCVIWFSTSKSKVVSSGYWCTFSNKTISGVCGGIAERMLKTGMECL